MNAPLYLIDCPKCAAPALSRCKTLTTGRTTDTHAERIYSQHNTPDRETAIRRAVFEVYGSFTAEYAPPYIDKNWDRLNRNRDQRDELMNYLWMNNSGGDTAKYAADRIREIVARWEVKQQG